MYTTVVFILEILGTVAFAASGAAVGIKKGMDIFGVSMLGLCTAVGGGVLRDLVLGNTPPLTFQDPVYALTAIAVSILTFLPCIQRAMERHPMLGEKLLGTMDAVGLGVFTAVGGGVLRDVLAGNMPYVFVKHFYACASIIGALLTALLWDLLGADAAMLLGAAAVVVLRLCAAHWRWSLPKAKAKG